MEDSDVWLRGPRSATSPGVESDLGCAQTKSARRSAGHAVRDLDISPEGGCVYPQRQQAMLELDLSGRLRPDAAGASSYPGEELVGVARGSEGIEGNCNLRSDDDAVYDEMLDLLPIAYNAQLLSFDESSSSSSSFRRPAWTSASWADSLGFDATPQTDDPFPAAATKLRSERVKGDGGGVAVVKDGSGQVRSEASVRRTTKAMSSVLKMIRSLDLLEEDEGQVPEEEEQQEGVVEGANSSSNDGAIHGFGVEELDQLIGKVEAWSANHGQLIEAAYRRGVQSSEMRLKRLSQQLMNFKHRLFEVSRDRQVITTYVRRHEQSWSCRHDRLRMEVLRLQKLVHDLQKSPDQLEESRQMYEGEGGGGGGGAGSGTGGEAEGGGRTGGRGGGGGGTTPQEKTDETMDKLLSVIVEHQSRINELKLTVFAQQQHILSLEEILREGNCPSLIDEDNNIQVKHRPHEENNVATPDAKSRSSKSNPITKESTRDKALEQIASGETATATKPTPSLPSPSSPETALGHFVSSKMSDVLLCDEGDYRLCQTNQPEVATDSTLTNIRCLCHKHGVACSSSAQVQLVGQLPYLMDSPLDTEVAGVLARPKARPFSLADLPYVRHSIATQRLAPEQTSGDLDFLL